MHKYYSVIMCISEPHNDTLSFQFIIARYVNSITHRNSRTPTTNKKIPTNAPVIIFSMFDIY